MVEEYDVIFIGAGHNALTCGAYLGGCGLKCAAFELRRNIGGGAATEEVTLPGFKHNIHSQYHGWIHAGPVYKELELENHGAKYIFPEIQYTLVLKDDRCLMFYQDLEKTCESIAKFSKKDAETYREMNKRFSHLRDIFLSAMFALPIPSSQQYALFEGTEDGLEFIRMMQASPVDLARELFESDEVVLWMMGMTTQMGNPQDMSATGVYLPMMFSAMHTKPWGICIGGSRMIAEALAKVFEEKGGKIFKETMVREIVIDNGRATGVILDDGRNIKAKKAIVSSTHPIATFTELIDENILDPKFVNKVKKFKEDDLMLFTPHYALNESPRWKAADKTPEIMDSFGVYFGLESSDDLQTQFNDIKMGDLPQRPGGLVTNTTRHDPTQAPPGKHTALIWQYITNRLKGGFNRWDEVKEELADRIEAVWREYAPNMCKPNILKRFVYTPLDIERNVPSMYRGSMMHGSTAPWQMGILRPFPSLRPYTTPIEGLYMCGASNHPSGGITGAAGYNCANVMAEDLKLIKWWKPFTPELSAGR